MNIRVANVEPVKLKISAETCRWLQSANAIPVPTTLMQILTEITLDRSEDTT